MQNLSMVVACTQNRVIGRENALPFKLKDDMRHFVKTTMGKKVIMGRKTFESILQAIGKPLPGRQNYVLTRDLAFAYPGVSVFNDVKGLAQELQRSPTTEEWVVIGGAEIYRQFLPAVNKLYLTQVEVELEGDAVFPEINFDEWEILNSEKFYQNEWNQYDFKILELQRKRDKNCQNF